MSGSNGQKTQPGRDATSAALRSLAVLVALLLASSSLGEIAHYLLVPHAICVEHGELLELPADSGHGKRGHDDHVDATDSKHSGSTQRPAEPAPRHDHCELLASGQDQLALPVAMPGALLPAPSGVELELTSVSAVAPALPTLALAPKTSPPRVTVG